MKKSIYKHIYKNLLKLQALLLVVGILLCGCKANRNPSSSGGDTASTDKLKIVYYVDGDIYTSSYYSEGEQIIPPEDPSKDGYSFIGWDTELPEFMPNSDISVHALFEANSYTLTYILNGEKYTEKTYSCGDTIENVLPEYDKDKYIFSGFANISSTMPACDIEIRGYLFSLDEINVIDLSSIADGDVLTISCDTPYMLTGTATNAKIAAEDDGDHIVILNNASITCLEDSGAIICTGGDSFDLILAEGSNNYICDSKSNTSNGAIYIKSADLNIIGSGDLNITSYSSGIFNTKAVSIEGGEISISSEKHGIVGKKSLNINYSKINIESESDGLKAKGQTEENGSVVSGTGNIALNGSDIIISSGKDGIQAEGDIRISNGSLNIQSLSDGIQASGSITLSGNEISITSGEGSTGETVYDSDGEEISTKGIKANGSIAITSGKAYINSLESALKADVSIEISGGTLELISATSAIKAESDDETSGDVTITGGNIAITTGKHGIYGAGSVYIENGIISIVTTGSETSTDSNSSLSNTDLPYTSASDGVYGNVSYNSNTAITSSKNNVQQSGIQQLQVGGNTNGSSNIQNIDIQKSDSGMQKPDGMLSQGNMQLPDGMTPDSNMQFKDGSMEPPDDMQIPNGDMQPPDDIQLPNGDMQPPDDIQLPDGNMQPPDDIQLPDGDMQPPDSSNIQMPSGDMQKPDGMQQGGFMQQWGNGNISIKSKGIKAGKHIGISGGNITIQSTGHAIASDGTLTIENDPVIELDAYYSGANSKGIKATDTLLIKGGNIKITRSYEGIESKSDIMISGGNIELKASDDGLNAGTLIAFSGGYVFANADGDGIDSNGDIEISGGTVIVAGPTSDGDGPLDCGDSGNHISVTGGFLLAYGSNGMAEYPSSSVTTQNTIGVNVSLSAGAIFSLRDEDGNDIITFEALKEAKSVCISSPDIQTGKTYTVYTGGTCQGEAVNGIYSISGKGTSSGSETTYSGGAEAETLTINEIVTLGSGVSSMGGLGGGGFGGGGMNGMGGGGFGGGDKENPGGFGGMGGRR